jgi:catechol 2,3-dioxygenase-like lactoylglutathione lyase family enzyme
MVRDHGRVAALFNVTLTTADVARLAAFWSAALGMTVIEQRADLARLAAPAGRGTNLLILRGDSPSAPNGRVHLDLAAADLVAEAGRLVELGAVLVDGGTPQRPMMRSANGISWIVMADADGNEFCVGGLPAGGAEEGPFGPPN